MKTKPTNEGIDKTLTLSGNKILTVQQDENCSVLVGKLPKVM